MRAKILTEQPRKLVVFSFGRMNPVTVGHEKLASAVNALAEKHNGVARIYLSHTQDSKKNPLPYDLKLKYAQAAFGPLVTNSAANTIIKVLQELEAEGFTDIIFVAGSDRIEEFKSLLNQYNGKEYNFNSINVASAGARDPDADGVEGMSASKMREAAATKDIKSFTGGLPAALQPAAATIMKAVRLGMKLTESITESEKASKAEANYQEEPKHGQRCINCTMWRDPHWCTAVAGEISPDGWCKWFAAGAHGKHGKLDEDVTSNIGLRFPDGEIKISDHFLERLPREEAPLSKYQAARMITNAVKKHGEEISQFPSGRFMLRGKGNAGVIMDKVAIGDKFLYVIKTGHPDFQRATNLPGIIVEDDLNIELHDELNPAIFKNGRMREDVRTNLLKIAEDFKESLGIELEGLKDITISGSNAAYNYTPKSDVDLHLIVDIPKVDNDQLYRELFDAKKFKYNAEHDYQVRGFDVELYVQDARDPHISQGIYSVLNDAWVNEPKRITTEIDRDAVRNKYDTIKHLINRAVKMNDYPLADKLRRMIKKYRHIGLQANGEFGPENLAFKALRANGYIKKLYDLINNIKDRELSIEGEEILDEVSMTPGALADFAKTPIAQGMKIGFEAEMIVHNLDYDMEDEGGEADYDMDERVDSGSLTSLTNDLYAFFRDTTGRRTIERAVEQFNEQVMEYMEDQFQEALSENQDELRDKVKDNMSSDATDEEIDAEIDEQGRAYDKAVDSMRDDFYETWDDLEGALGRFDLEMMTDWAREYDFDWPHYTGGSSSDEISEESMNAVAKEISTALGGVKVRASTGYHSVKRDPELWILETDSSIDADPEEGDGGLELVSPPMPLAQGLEKLDQLFNWMQKADVDTDSSTGFHMGVSIPEQTMENVDHLKLILFLGDQHVLQTFGRSSNNYTKSILDKVEGNIERFPNPAAIMDFLKKGLDSIALKTIGGLIIPKGDRYVSINIKDKYIEFRSAGGDYMNKQEQIKNTLLRYVRVMAIAADPEAERVEYAKKLYKVLAANSTPDDADKLKLFILHQQGNLSKEEFIKRLKARHSKGEPEPQGPMDWEMRHKVSDIVITHMFGTRQQATEYFKNVANRQGHRNSDWYMVPKNPPPSGPAPSGPSGPTQSYEVRQQPGNNYVTTVTASSPQEAVNTATQRFPGYAGSMSAQPLPPSGLPERRYRIQYGTSNTDIAILYARTPEEAVRIAASRDPNLDSRLIRAQVVEESEEVLDEVSMSPGALADYAKTPFAQSMKFGFEAEMIVPDLAGEDDDEFYDPEPDLDYDENIENGYDTWDDFKRAGIRFFTDNGANARADVQEVFEIQRNKFMDYVEDSAWENHAREEVKAWIADKYGEDWPAQLELFSKADETDDERILRLRSNFERQYSDRYYEPWFKENEGELMAEWMGKKNIETWWDISQRWALAWPFYQEGGSGNSGGTSIEELAQSWKEFSGAPVKVSSGYHSAQRDATSWIFEPDSSIRADEEGYGGIELISPPMQLAQGMEALDNFFDWAADIGARGNRSTGFHMGLSIPEQTLENVDHLKLILFLGDQYVLDQFNRSHNSYTKSILAKIKSAVEVGTTRLPLDQAMDMLRKGLDQAANTTLNRLAAGSDRYISVNIKSGYVEFRSAGGNFMANKDKLKNTLFRYVRAMGLAADPNAEKQEYAKKLYKLLSLGLGDSGDTVKLFSMYASGSIPRIELKNRLQKQQAARQQKKQPPQPDNETKTWYPWSLVPLGDHSESNVLRFRARNRAEAEEYAADLAERHGIRTYELEAGYTESMEKDNLVRTKMNELKRRKGKKSEPLEEGPVWNKVKNTAVAGAMAAGLGAGGAHLAAKTTTEPMPIERPAATMQAEPSQPLAVNVSKEVPNADEKPMPSTATAADPKMERMVFLTAQQAGLKGEELAQFMAQVAHETLGFQEMVEQGDKNYFNRYDPKHSPKMAKALGNIKPGDGERYKGRGFLQITGRDNYKRAGEALGLPLEKKPQLAERPEVAARIAIWFWNNRVKPRVDDFNDTASVTSRINPGLRGINDRDLNFQSYLKKFNVAKSESRFTNEQINAMLGGHLIEDLDA